MVIFSRYYLLLKASSVSSSSIVSRNLKIKSSTVKFLKPSIFNNYPIVKKKKLVYYEQISILMITEKYNYINSKQKNNLIALKNSEI